MTEEDVKEFECKVCPTCGSCSGMYTANSMNCLTEVLGMGLTGQRNDSGCLLRASGPGKACRYGGYGHAGEEHPSERHHDRGRHSCNALTVDMALGCSTNSMLHLPAIAHEAGVELNVDIANEISARDSEPVPSGTGRTDLYGRSERGRRRLRSHERDQQAWIS